MVSLTISCIESKGIDKTEDARKMNISETSADCESAPKSPFRFKADFLRTYELTKGNVIKRIIACYRSPGLHAVAVYRFGHWVKKQNLFLRIFFEPLYMILFHRIRSKWGIEISRATQIGSGLYIGHPGGITISGLAKIGNNVSISQLVTIGISGKGKNRGVPVIGNNVYIAPGAKIFGKIQVGSNVKIGANAVVHKDIPDDVVVVLDPGFRIISYRDKCGDSETLIG